MAGQDVSGMDRAQVEDLVTRRAATATVTISVEGTTLTVPLGDLAQVDASATAGAAVDGNASPWRLIRSLVSQRETGVVAHTDPQGVTDLLHRLNSSLASPPQAEFGGLPHPTILAACALLGLTEVYAVGGAQAIAMLAYGAHAQDDTDRADVGGEVLCQQVDVITGPGNVYVAAAKRAVMGVVGIDAEAGPTEIAVLADAGANPEYVAADLLSQAEHDPNAGSVLITDSPELADAVDAALERRLSATRHRARAAAALTGPQSGTVLVRDLDQAIEVADAYAAEHLEIHTADAPAVARRIRNAGAVFIGPYSPVPLGDYLAGSNHVLPTGGTARFAAGLSVMAFLKPVQLIEYNASALEAMTPALEVLARCEDLPAHGEAARARQG